MSSARSPQDKLRLIARRMNAYVDASAQARGQRPSPSSQVATDVRDNQQLPMREVWLASDGLLTVVEDHLRLLAAAVEAPHVTLGVITAGRLALELAAQAYWLTEPELTATERAGRYFSYLISDAHRTADFYSKAGDKMGAEAGRVAAADRDRHVDRARAAGLDVGKLASTTTVAKESVPRATANAGVALGDDAWMGSLLYERASAVVHGRLSGLLNHSDDAEGTDREEGIARRSLRLTNGDLGLAISTPVMTHHATMTNLMKSKGQLVDPRWGATHHQLWVFSVRPLVTDGRLPAELLGPRWGSN